jgi:hypothetical protein
MIVGMEYVVAIFLLVLHYIKLALELKGDSAPYFFSIIVITVFIALASLALYALGIKVARWGISRRLRISIVIVLQAPLLLTAGFLAIALWIDLESMESIAAAFVASMVVLQIPILISRLLDATH